MWQLYLLILIQLVSGVGLLILLRKMSKMKKQVDEITKEVKDYISFVIEDEEETAQKFSVNTYEESAPMVKKSWKKQKSDEAQSSLIQAVLGDIFCE